MAQYNLGSAGDISSINDFHKVQQYLYKMNENLRYMFNNLTPEDNYSEQARLTYVADGERQSTIEVTLDHINLQMVDKDEVVSAINMSKEQVKILAEKIALEGLVTVNSYFQIGLDGSITARNGKFSGNITASTMNSSAITLGGNGLNGNMVVLDDNDLEIGHWNKNGFFISKGVINLPWNGSRGLQFSTDNYGDHLYIGDFKVDMNYGRQVLQSDDEVTGMSGEPDLPGGYYLWAGWTGSDNTVVFCAKSDRSVRVNGLFYYNGEELEAMIRRIAEEYEDDDDGGEGGGGSQGTEEPNPTGGETGDTENGPGT